MSVPLKKCFKMFFFNLVSMGRTEWSTIPACPSFVCSFGGGSVGGGRGGVVVLALRKVVFDVWVSMYVLYLCGDQFCGIDLGKRLYVRRVLNCASAYDGV